MHVLNMAHETAAARDRASRMFTLSLVAHVALVGWLLLHRQFDPMPEGLVEVTWLEAAAPAPAPVAVRAPEPRPAEPEPVVASEPAPEPEKFERPEPEAAVVPTPQVATANRDKVQERLATLQPSSLVGSAADAKLTRSSSLLRSAATAAPAPARGVAATELTRAAGERRAPRALTRSTEPVRRPVVAAAVNTALPDEPRRAADLDLQNASHRSLHAAELAGEVADRRVLSHALPAYPDWATTQAVEASVTLYFEVLPDGRVKENLQVRRTAGFADFDNNAMDALRHWRFAPLPAGSTSDQWGTITFHYRLRG